MTHPKKNTAPSITPNNDGGFSEELSETDLDDVAGGLFNCNFSLDGGGGTYHCHDVAGFDDRDKCLDANATWHAGAPHSQPPG